MKFKQGKYQYVIKDGKIISKVKLVNGRIKKEKTKNKAKIEWEKLRKQAINKKYPDFLKTKYWKAVKTLVLKRDKHKCTVCESTIKLNVHHTTYKNHYKEHKHTKELLTLCEKCHHEYHLVFDVV